MTYRLYTLNLGKRCLEAESRSIFSLRPAIRQWLVCKRLGARGMFHFCGMRLEKEGVEAAHSGWRKRWSAADHFREVAKKVPVAAASDLFEWQ